METSVIRGNAQFEPRMSAFHPIATGRVSARQGDVEPGCHAVIQASKQRGRIMRYEFTDYEWVSIRSKPRTQANFRTATLPLCRRRSHSASLPLWQYRQNPRRLAGAIKNPSKRRFA